MPGSLSLVLPFPPSVNTYWRHPSSGLNKGRHLISAKGRQYRCAVTASVLEQNNNRKPKTLTTAVSLSLTLFPPTDHRRDLDNFVKAIQDSLTYAGIWQDDAQVKRLTVEWGAKIAGGSVLAIITPYSLKHLEKRTKKRQRKKANALSNMDKWIDGILSKEFILK